MDMPMRSGGVNHEITLVEEEISDVTLATFYIFNKENIGGGCCISWGGCRLC
jgi:hypothetical protein